MKLAGEIKKYLGFGKYLEFGKNIWGIILGV